MERLPDGSVFAGHRVESELGHGGMGIVYRARHLALDAPRALKVITPQLASDEQFRERFKREARLAASIDHPNVIPIHDADEVDGVLYISMRYVPGTDLDAVIETEGRLDPSRAARLIADVAEALDAAHEQSLVHRDVKPANILIEPTRRGRERYYLTDFGLTKPLASESGFTQTGMMVGTVDYMAPEQFTGAALDARTDVYALGGVLFKALTGQIPYPRADNAQKMFAHTSVDPPSVLAVVADADPRLDSAVRRAMAKEPQDRFSTAGDFGGAALAAAEPAVVDPTLAPEPTQEAAPVSTPQQPAERQEPTPPPERPAPPPPPQQRPPAPPPPPPPPPPAPPRAPVPRAPTPSPPPSPPGAAPASRDNSWEWRNSIWVLWPILSFGFLAAAGFCWAGARVKRNDWIVWGIVYSCIAFAAAGFASSAEEDSALSTAMGLVLIVNWIASLTHALLIRRPYVVGLAKQPSHARAIAGRAQAQPPPPPPPPGRGPYR